MMVVIRHIIIMIIMTIGMVTVTSRVNTHLVMTPPPQVTRFCLAWGITHHDSRVDLVLIRFRLSRLLHTEWQILNFKIYNVQILIIIDNLSHKNHMKKSATEQNVLQ